MSTFHNQSRIATIISFSTFKWFAIVIALAFLAAAPLNAQEVGPDGQYLLIYGTIDEADALDKAGKAGEAKAKYQEAQSALLKFKKENPTWKPKVVDYRLSYLAGKIFPPVAPSEPASVAAKTETKAQAKPVAAKAKEVPLAPPKLKLLEAGAEPRKELRLQPKTGDKQAFVMTMKMGMDMGMGQPMKMPAVKTDLDMTVKNVSAEGDITYETVMGETTVVEEPDAQPQMVQMMKASMSGIKGLSATGVVSSRGFNKSSSLKIPAGVNPQTRQSMEQMKESMANMSPMLPKEAVGVGAKWEVEQTVKSQGMTIDQTIAYELVSIEGTKVNLKSSMTQKAANQKIANPSMPQMKMDLEKMEGDVTGNIVLDSNYPWPSLTTMDAKTDMAMSINAGGKKQPMNMKMTMEMRLETK